MPAPVAATPLVPVALASHGAPGCAPPGLRAREALPGRSAPVGAVWPGRPGGRREAYVPAQQPSPCPQARLSRSHEHSRWARGHQGPPGQGPRPPVGLIRRIRERRAFERLAHHGTRVRSTSLWCSYLHDPELGAPHVAFAISRAVGPAVVRNRLRRRVRSVLHELQRDGDLPACWLSIGARPSAAELTFDQVRLEVRRLISRIPAAPTTVTTTSEITGSATSSSEPAPRP